jgi:inhibitor of cysteine peptidase
VLATLLLVACGRDGDDSVVAYQQPGASIAVGVGQRFAVELDGNPTTGYSWQLAAAPGDQVRLVDDDFTPSGGQIGSGGVQRFTFEALATGTTSLAFAYVRPWETGVAPVNAAQFPVKVT